MNVTPGPPLNINALRDRYAFASLVRPLTGMMTGVSAVIQEPMAPQFETSATSLGNLTMTFPYLLNRSGGDLRNEALGGAGADLDRDLAWIRAVVEGAERYCSFVLEDNDSLLASARELGAEAVAFLESVPRCSEMEYADPLCPLRPPDPDARIRWVQGYSLTEERKCYVPAVMTHLGLRLVAGEAFWQSISTGVAAQTSLTRALIGGICEVIERDAIAITWLARLPLPRIVIDTPPPESLAPNYDALTHSTVQQLFFDATSDLGIPTVYSVQLTDGHPRLSQYVSCATALDPAVAVAKTIREAAPVRSVLNFPQAIPDRIQDFVSLQDGAIYMGRPERRSSFDFLLKSTRSVRLSDMPSPAPGGDEAQLEYLLERLRQAHMHAIAVDLTTSEVGAAGLWVVRVVIPELMPMNSVYRARCLGHPRLYTYPEQAGFGKREESDINRDPQPFA